MSTSGFLSSLTNMLKIEGGVLPKRRKSSSKRLVKRTINNAYMIQRGPSRSNLVRNKVYHRPTVVKEHGLNDDFVNLFSSLNVARRTKPRSRKRDVAMSDGPVRRSERTKNPVDRYHPSSEPKRVKGKSKSASKRSSKSGKKSRSRSKSRSPMLMNLDFSKLRL